MGIMMRAAHAWSGRVLGWCADVLAPRVCVACGDEGAWICAPCTSHIPLLGNFVCGRCDRPSPFGKTCITCRRDFPVDHVIAVASYAVPCMQRIVRMVKYVPAHDVAQAYASIVAMFCARPEHMALRGVVGPDSILIPIPLHWSRELERGFNQSVPIADAFARAGWGTVRNDVLLRVRRATPQATLVRAMRLENMQHAFVVQDTDVVRGRAVVLVDDVITTGATVASAAHALRRAGASTVSVCAFAKG
ncbi:ComF family protein [Candidatus Uhrbacteria bacterium]|nr:ComF family protein [Candidatus Uhrbacteria bacterium]